MATVYKLGFGNVGLHTHTKINFLLGIFAYHSSPAFVEKKSCTKLTGAESFALGNQLIFVSFGVTCNRGLSLQPIAHIVNWFKTRFYLITVLAIILRAVLLPFSNDIMSFRIVLHLDWI